MMSTKADIRRGLRDYRLLCRENDPVVNDGVIDDSVTDPGKWTTAFPRAVMKAAQSNQNPLC